MRSLALFCLLSSAPLFAQWQMQDAHVTADLRGIDNVGGGVAWASGSNGTVLRTEDAGFVWQLCAIPPNAEHLDFRGIQAFDNNTAIVMSSGKGDLSRLYKTTDGCQTWKLLFTNPDKDGFWDALVAENRGKDMILLGDPVGGHFRLWTVNLSGVTSVKNCPKAWKAEGSFAASNTSLVVHWVNNGFWFATGGADGSRVFHPIEHNYMDGVVYFTTWGWGQVPVGSKNASSGVFSIGFREPLPYWAEYTTYYGVAVGGDYLRQDASARTAAYSVDGGQTWKGAITPPHGYRSAVAYDPTHNTWITVGPNGTDICTDDGRNWRALRPNLADGDAPDADQHWNALSLPYAVGPHGRIGKLEDGALGH